MSFIDSLQNAIRGSGGKPTLYLGVLGKHPGWDDHLDDFGLESEALLAVKQLLYVQGIGGVIDSGAWDNLAAEDSIGEFKHWLVWKAGDDFIAGRIWSSVDRKGRARYPMVACVHISNAPNADLLPWLAPRLLAIEKTCRQTAEAADVVRYLVSEREALRSDLVARIEQGTFAPHTTQLSAVPSCSMEEWMRIVYSSETQLTRFSPEKLSRDTSTLNRRLVTGTGECQHLRFPSAPLEDLTAIAFWNNFLKAWIAPNATCLILKPDNEPWMDVIAGRPTSKQLFCLKAKPSVLPKASDIPFTITPEFREQASKRFAWLISPTKPEVPVHQSPVSPSKPLSSLPTGNEPAAGDIGLPSQRTSAKGIPNYLWVIIAALVLAGTGLLIISNSSQKSHQTVQSSYITTEDAAPVATPAVATRIAAATPTPSPLAKPVSTPTATPLVAAATPAPVATPSPVAKPVSTPTATPLVAAATPAPVATPSPVAKPVSTPTATPLVAAATPAPVATPSPAAKPVSTPTATPLVAAATPAPVATPPAIKIKTLAHWQPSLPSPDQSGWTWVQPDESQNTVCLQFRGKPALTFRLVKDGDKAFYLCETELSIGIVHDWLGTHSDFVNEPRKSWGSRVDSHKLATGWYFSRPNGSQIEVSNAPWAPYDNVSGELPSRDHPLNWISAILAQRLAGNMGCRLPHLSEWKAAAKQIDESAAGSPHLRDAAWERFWKSLEAKTSDRRAVETIRRQSESQVFKYYLNGAKPQSPLSSQNDKTVWFRKVEEGDGPFLNFYGNVAEFLTDDEHENVYFVAGGSALSGADIDPKKPLPLPFPNQDYPDVGIRLALDAVPSVPRPKN